MSNKIHYWHTDILLGNFSRNTLKLNGQKYVGGFSTAVKLL